ncbi:MAG: AsmA-like C-terminal region-containing protein [Kiritimatiellae bacterium]|nr:AsmA-like C-terminal region-containing protein [Kiritimatiellia bacterium]
MAFSLLRKIKYILFILFVAGLILLFYLTSVGLPRALVRKIEPYLQFSGMILNLDRIKLSVFEGIVATGVKYYKKGDVGDPIIQADRFVLKLEPLAWMRGGNGVSGAVIKKGRACFSPDKPGAEKIIIDDIYADVLFERPARRAAAERETSRPRLKILGFSAAMAAFKLSGKGVIVLPAEKISLKNGAAKHAESSGVDAAGLDLSVLAGRLDDFTAGNAVNADVDFYIDPDNIEKLSFKADLHGRHTRYADVAIGVWSANMLVSGRSASGNITLKNTEIKQIQLQSLDVLLNFDEKGMLAASLKSTINGAPQAGPLDLQLNYNLASGKFEGKATTGCDLRAFAPFLQSLELKLGDIFAAFDFKRSLPAGNIAFQGEFKTAFSCRLSGDVLVDTLSFRKVPCLLVKLGFEAELNDAGEKVNIRNLLVVRDEGLARGNFIYESDDKTISFSGMSVADPPAVAAMIDPVIASPLEAFSFKGPCYITAFGTVGYASSALNDAEINFNATDVAWKMFRFASCALALNVCEESYQIDDFYGSICRGIMKGSASVDPAAGSSNMIFTLSADAENVDFGVLINSLSGRQLENTYEGICSGALNLQGFVDDPGGTSMKGKGWIKIMHGRIFTVPIFGGLFDILGKIIPGLGSFNGKNNAQATLTVEKGKVHGSNIYIDGDVFSLKGAGDIYFDGRLDFKVQVTFMRHQSLIGNLLQIVTMPLSKALEFRLGGTVANPKWEAAYLPF